MRILICFLLALMFVASIHAQTGPPPDAVSLVFIHHSTGEGWLGGGGLRQALNDSNYYVTDANYGWGPDGIGDNTDVERWGDSHPGDEGHQKATGELVSLLNLAYNGWNAGETYYVATGGDDGDPGTSDQPWATPGYGSKQLQAGDTLIIRDGTYVLSQFYDDMITPLNSGTSEAWITIKGEDGSTPVLAGRDNLFSAINLDGVSYIMIENLEITSDGGAWFRDGVSGDDLSHIELNQLNIHHIDEFGVNLGDIDNLLVDECAITYCGFGSIGGPAGDSGGWQNVLISDCDLSYSGHYYRGGDGSDRPYERPDGFGIEESTGPIEIVDCTAEHNKGDGLDSKAENTYIHNCVVSNNSCDGIKLWGDNSRVHNCLIYGTGDGVPGATPWAAFVIGTDTENAYFEIINVTIHDTTETQNYPMYVQYDSVAPIALVMKNSIVAGGYGTVFIGNSVAFTAEHNIFYRPENDPQVEANGRDYTAQQIEAGELGTGNRSADPLFVTPAWGAAGDYHLRDGSPAIDTGTSGAGIPDTDLGHDPRPEGSAYDMGAYECAVSGEPTSSAPSDVTDLTANSSATGNSIDLGWTAPGNDGDAGTASLYIIRYNTDPITESNWDASTEVDGEPAPQAAGSAESMTIGVPYPGITYYFAIKTQDDEENVSEISNSPSAIAEAILLYAGWNLVSLTCMIVIPIDDLLASLPQCEAIWVYYASIPGWLRHVVGGPDFLNTLTNIGPGYGLWILVTEDCVWDCSAVGAASPSNPVVRRPPFLLYGKVGQSGTISARYKDKEAASYVMGSEPRYGDYYVLEIPVDTTFHEGDNIQIYVNGAPTDGHPIEHGGMGVVRRHDISRVKPPVTLLMQNYPNPFNPETWIPYQLTTEADVTIRIYDVAGQAIRTLNLGHQPAGFYTSREKAAYWDGKNGSGEYVASGVYFYSFRAGEYSAMKKMTATE